MSAFTVVCNTTDRAHRSLQRADAMRLFFLHKDSGIYTGLDMCV